MINKITEADIINKGVVGLPDVPGLTTIEMQNKFEEISRDVIIPRFNELIDCTVSASDEFSKLSTYNVGDYCIYQSVLYKCTTEINTAGEWDATKWKATAIDKELKEISSTSENKDAISDKYDSSKTYAVGDYCIYNDTLYKCKTAVTSAEEFDSIKWEATNCGKELVALNSNLTVLIPITETGSTTSRAYNFGEVIRYGNNLYVAAQNIAQGTNINDAITVGYFVATNVVSKINGLNNNLNEKIVINHFDLTFTNGTCTIESTERTVISVMPIGSHYTCGISIVNLTPITYSIKINENETYNGTITCRIVYVK